MCNRQYIVAKCPTDKVCKKCSSISDTIVVNSGTHYTLYCSDCGAYLKHASRDDRRYIYASKVKVKEKTPIKLCSIYEKSEKTMFH